MQVPVQNVKQQNNQYNSSFNSTAQTPCCTQPTTQQVQSVPQGYVPPQNTIYPQYQPAQNQNMQIPATASGVNIQIFNPSVATPGAQAPTYNVNAPCYPSGYYTSSVGADGKLHPNNGSNNPHTGDNVNNGTNSGTIGDNNNNTYTTNTNTTNNTTTSTNSAEKEDNKKKTEKRKIVQLTDEYIKNLEITYGSWYNRFTGLYRFRVITVLLDFVRVGAILLFFLAQKQMNTVSDGFSSC